MNWLTFLLAVSLASVTVLSVVLLYLLQRQWMRIFSLKQGIPIESTEVKREVMDLSAKVDHRKRVSIPVPGADMFRKTQ